MDKPIAFHVNGQPIEIRANPGLSLLTALRENLDLKATRFGCGAEACGACTVIVDGTARYACTLPVGDIEGQHVLTAESLDAKNFTHPLLAAFLARQAGQCGYCLSGILMRARALLESGEQVNRQRVAQELDANLCRCGAHGRILDAVMDAAAQMGVAK
jgi:aerobic-type carbon monoxide dehydrogenase small subunit (CoxS/CutS family)|tara:strand:+ start:2319 stop:2795 length:477 start_codon:yes stop_codon:yes gene_type:complete